jgi:hypothetical protein
MTCLAALVAAGGLAVLAAQPHPAQAGQAGPITHASTSTSSNDAPPSRDVSTSPADTTGVEPTTTASVDPPPAPPNPVPVTTPAASKPVQDLGTQHKTSSTADLPIADVGWDVPLPAPHLAPPHVDRDDLARQLTRRGWSNGQLADSALVDVDGCRLLPAAADAWRTLQAAAAADGLVLGTSQCYRSLADQTAAQQEWCAEHTCQNAATPGRSMHGWGLAVDVAVDGKTIGFASPAFRWLVQHGPEFGFYHPDWADAAGTAPEPWHFEYQAPIG